jgi:hypothetical protein
MESIGLLYVRRKISASEYWYAQLAKISFVEQCQGCDVYAERLKESLGRGFWALDKLDRDDPFWRGTNGLATIGKLSGFADYQIKNGKDLLESAWLAIATRLLNGESHLELEWWKVLGAGGEADANFVIRTAWNMSPYWSDGKVVKVSSLVTGLGMETSARCALEMLALEGVEEKKWSNEVILNLSAI